MDVRLPDGTIVKGVPDDMSKADFAVAARRNGYNIPDDTPQPAAPAPTKPEPDSVLSRIGTGLADPIYGAAQIADKGINLIRQAVSPGASSMEDIIKQRDAEYRAPEGVDWARMAGNVANPVSWAGSMSKLGAAAKAVNALPRTVQAALAGSGQAILAPTQGDDLLNEKVAQASLGAAGGAVISKLARGFIPTPEAKALMDQGVQPTFGQSWSGIGPTGIGSKLVNSVEQKLTSVPFVGDAITYARGRPLKEFEQAALSRVAPGAKTLDEANAYAGKLYDEVAPKLVPTKEATANIMGAVNKAMQNPEMTEQNKTILAGLINQQFANFPKLAGDQVKKLDSELGYLARKYQGGDPASKTLAGEIYNVQAAMREGLEAGLPPNLRGKLQTANQTWRDLIPLNKAASTRADEQITPRALQKAMARQQRTDITRMRPDALVDSAIAVLPSSVPDSGTAGRILLGGGAALGANTFGVLPQMAAVGIPAALGATRPVQRALLGGTAWQKLAEPHDASLSAALSAALRAATTRQKQDE